MKQSDYTLTGWPMGCPGGLTGKGRAEVLVPPDWLYVEGCSLYMPLHMEVKECLQVTDRPRACSKYQESVTRRLLDGNILWWRIHLVQV